LLNLVLVRRHLTKHLAVVLKVERRGREASPWEPSRAGTSP
jgi:hypothetical protein